MTASAILWAIACCAAGSLIGFIFGIPRSLSSDTARHTVPVQNPVLEDAKNKAIASTEALNTAVDEKEQADKAAQEISSALVVAEEKATRLLAGAEKNSSDTDARSKSDKAQEELAEIKKRKNEADEVILKNSTAVKNAQQQVQKDQANVAVIQTRGVPKGNIQEARGPSTAVNTNLEQISDWLTKIIVGVSLVNSEKLGGAMLSAARIMANSIGSGPDKVSVALAIMIFFGMTGLLGGYLLTRLFLQRAFETAGNSNLEIV